MGAAQAWYSAQRDVVAPSHVSMLTVNLALPAPAKRESFQGDLHQIYLN